MKGESLEELKVIIDNAVDGDLFFDGRYLNEKLHVRGSIDKYGVSGVKSYVVYDAPLYINTGKLHSLSDIKQIIELKERVKENWKAYGRIEAIKQEYNAENKQLKERLKNYE